MINTLKNKNLLRKELRKTLYDGMELQFIVEDLKRHGSSLSPELEKAFTLMIELNNLIRLSLLEKSLHLYNRNPF